MGNYILSFKFCFSVDFVEFILLCFYHDLYNYCNRICSSQAFHVLHVDGYAKAVVISTFDDCDILDKASHLTVNVYHDSILTIKVRKDMYVYCNYSRVRICEHVRNTNVLLARFPLLF